MDTAESNEAKDKHELLYKIGDIPPWYICILLGFQVVKKNFKKKKTTITCSLINNIFT